MQKKCVFLFFYLQNSFKISIFVLQTRGKEIPDKLTEFLTGRRSKKNLKP